MCWINEWSRGARWRIRGDLNSTFPHYLPPSFPFSPPLSQPTRHHTHYIPSTPPTFSPEGHGEPHTHHHQSDAPIFWTKTGEEIPPNLSEIELSQTVAALTSNTPISPCLYPTTSLQFTYHPTHCLPLHSSHFLLSLSTIQSLITCPPRFDARTPQRWYQVPVSDWISINSSS